MEAIFYYDKEIYSESQIISWMQKFMELFLKEKEHPKWFYDVLNDLHGNFYVPHGKYFFDEEIINDNPIRLAYCIKMLDLTIHKMKHLTKKEFFDFIKDDLKGTWCDISNGFYQTEDFLYNEQNYNIHFVKVLQMLKAVMEEHYSLLLRNTPPQEKKPQSF